MSITLSAKSCLAEKVECRPTIAEDKVTVWGQYEARH